MNMATGGGHDMAMVPWFHFTPGDYLLFQSWRPRSFGAVFAACLGLVLLGIFDRWLAATRSVLERSWRHRALASSGESVPQSIYSELPDTKPGNGGGTYSRTIPPFVFAYDTSRGLMHAGQALLSYILMLSVMTFNVSFLISIVVGLGVGEMMFGRIGHGRRNH